MGKPSEIAYDHPGVAHDGELTFVGVLRKYFVDYDVSGENRGISKKWNDNTKGAFINDYERRLIPVLDDLFGKEKPLHSFTEEEFEQVLGQLSERYHYADSTLLHYRRLLWGVYREGFERGLYVDNIFWGDIFDPLEVDEETREEHRVKTMTRIRKSFGLDEELRIIQWFKKLDPVLATGEDIGQLFMFFEGVRNNEACGADYGSVRMQSTKRGDIPVFEMLQSTEIDSSEVKPSGKTWNAPRVLPMFEPFYEFLMERRNYLEGLIATGHLTLTPKIQSVDQLPIVCVGNNYTRRASSRYITKAARKFFEQIGIEKSALAVLHQILFSQEFKETQIDEKEPTAYLYRRNCATHLYRMGFSVAMIQYWMGHEIEDPGLTRNSFADEDVLYDLAMKYRKHPFYALFDGIADELFVLDDCYFTKQRPAIESQSFSFTLASNSNQYIVDLKAKEPRQPISVNISSDKGTFNVVVDATSPQTSYSKTTDIFRQQVDAYKNFGPMT